MWSQVAFEGWRRPNPRRPGVGVGLGIPLFQHAVVDRKMLGRVAVCKIRNATSSSLNQSIVDHRITEGLSSISTLGLNLVRRMCMDVHVHKTYGYWMLLLQTDVLQHSASMEQEVQRQWGTPELHCVVKKSTNTNKNT